MLLTIDKKSDKTIFEQLLLQIIRLIDDGTLEPGFRMPPSRELAELLGINRTTVIHVYEELWASGYIESRPGSYTLVRKRKSIVRPEPSSEASEKIEGVLYKDSLEVDLDFIERFIKGMEKPDDDAIDLMHLSPDSRLVDKNIARNCLREVLLQDNPDPFHYFHPGGYPPLRLEILKHMKLHNIFAGDENILITNGSQQSLQLIFQTFSKPGDYIVVESPTYPLLFPMLQLFRLKVIEVPVFSLGMDLRTFTQVLNDKKIRFVYTMPTFHNPAGISMPQAEREELLQLCRDKGCIIIEDSIEEELKYYGRVHLPIKSIDDQNQVIYLGTFSKVFAPGLRTGWIIASATCIRKLTAVKTILEISSNSLSQLFLYKFCQSGAYELHLRKLMRIMKKRMSVAISSIKKYVPPEKISWTEPNGGFLIWIELRTKPIANIEDHFVSYGVKISDGKIYFKRPSANNYIRISISNENGDRIEEGIKRIGRAIEDLI